MVHAATPTATAIPPAEPADSKEANGVHAWTMPPSAANGAYRCSSGDSKSLKWMKMSCRHSKALRVRTVSARPHKDRGKRKE